jgi:transducin (beta)-like 1
VEVLTGSRYSHQILMHITFFPFVGYVHSAYCFGQESFCATNPSIVHGDVPSGYLVTLILKGLQFASIEQHVGEDGRERECNRPYLLLEPHVCSVTGERNNERSVTSDNNKKKQVKRKRKDKTLKVPVSEEESNIDTLVEAGSNHREQESSVKSEQLQGSVFLTGHQAEVTRCAWSPGKEDTLATASGDSTARIWNGLNNHNKHTSVVLTHESETSSMNKACDVTTLDWNHDGTLLATACYDGRARVWDEQGKLLHTLSHHRGPIFALKWNPSGTHLLSGGFDQIAIAWNIDQIGRNESGHGDNSASPHQTMQSWAQNTAPILDLDWADDRRFATCSTDTTITIMELERPNPIRTLRGHTNEVNSIAWDPTGTILASGSDDTTAKVRND